MNDRAAAGISAAARFRSRIPAPVIPLLAILLLLPAVPFLVELSHYAVNIFMQAATFAVAVLGLAVVLGYTGQFSLAQAAFFGLGSYAVGLGTVVYGLNFWVALLLGVTVAAAFGFVIGLTTLRLGGHYLAMITISFQEIFDLVMTNWIAFTRGPDGIAGIPRPSLAGHALTDDRVYLVLCAVVLYAVIAVLWWLPDTRMGRAMKAVRENELAAEVTGVPTLQVKVIAFTISAALGASGAGSSPRASPTSAPTTSTSAGPSSSSPWCCSADRSRRSAPGSGPSSSSCSRSGCAS